MTPRRPTTGGVQIPTGPPVAYGPSLVSQCYQRDAPALSVMPAQRGDQNQRETEVRDLFQGPPGLWQTVHDDLEDEGPVDQTQNDESQIAVPVQPTSPIPSSSSRAPPPGCNPDGTGSGGDGASNPGRSARSGDGGLGSNPPTGGGSRPP